MVSLSSPGGAQVQVIVGNHTKAALKLQQEEGVTDSEYYQFVKKDIYAGFSPKQALFQEYTHDKIHENVMEKEQFIRSLKERIK